MKEYLCLVFFNSTKNNIYRNYHYFVQKYRFASKSISLVKAEELKSKIRSLELERAQKDEKIRHIENDLSIAKEGLTSTQRNETELKEALYTTYPSVRDVFRHYYLMD